MLKENRFYRRALQTVSGQFTMRSESEYPTQQLFSFIWRDGWGFSTERVASKIATSRCVHTMCVHRTHRKALRPTGSDIRMYAIAKSRTRYRYFWATNPPQSTSHGTASRQKAGHYDNKHLGRCTGGACLSANIIHTTAWLAMRMECQAYLWIGSWRLHDR